LAQPTFASEIRPNRMARRVAGTLLGCKSQNNFHFLQSLQLHRSEFHQTDGDKLENAGMN